jgi:hypothetical protein
MHLSANFEVIITKDEMDLTMNIVIWVVIQAIPYKLPLYKFSIVYRN